MAVSVRMCSSTSEEQRSLEIYNEVWPRRAATDADVQAWKQASVATADFLGAVDGADRGIRRCKHRHLGPIFLQDHRDRAAAPSTPGRRLGAFRCAFRVDGQAWRARTRDRGGIRRRGQSGLRTASRLPRVFARDRSGAELGATDPPVVDPLAGIEIVLLPDHPELATGAYAVGVEALPDVPGNEDWTPPPLEQFMATHLRGPAVFVAIADGEVVGYAKLHARPDGRTAEHRMTAVKRAWRGRGIAKSLKLAEIDWARANGVERLTATNEERNTGMQRVNVSLGYKPAPGRVKLRGPATAR